MSTAPRSGAAPARSSISRRRRCASGTPRVWMPTSATRVRSGFASMISCAIRDSVRRSASASSRTVPAGASTALTAQAGSTVCGQPDSYDSFPASLDRLKGVRVEGQPTRPAGCCRSTAQDDPAERARPIDGRRGHARGHGARSQAPSRIASAAFAARRHRAPLETRGQETTDSRGARPQRQALCRGGRSAAVRRPPTGEAQRRSEGGVARLTARTTLPSRR